MPKTVETDAPITADPIEATDPVAVELGLSDANDMPVERVPIASLVLDPENARKGDVKAVAESLREFGQHRVAVVQRGTNKVIAGNTMMKAAQVLGWTHLNVTFVDDDELRALRRSLSDNMTSDRSSWDEELLGQLVTKSGPVPGFGQASVNSLLAKLTPEPEPEAIYPILARPNEKYDYVLVVATSEMDWAFLETFFQLRKEMSYKRDKVALSHVVTVERLHEVLTARGIEVPAIAEPAPDAVAAGG